MATFQIKTPDGYEVEVRAGTQNEALEIAKKNWQTMPRIIGRKGDVRIFERSNGDRYLVGPNFSTIDQEIINKVMEGADPSDASKKSWQKDIDQERISSAPIAARANEVVRGVPFIGSYADEAVGAFSPQAAQNMRATTGAMQRERPKETLGLNIAGGLTGAGLAALAAPATISGAVSGAIGQGSRAAQIGRGALAGASAGAIEGAVYGAGEGTQGTRDQEAAQGATFGGIGGGLLGGAAPVAREAVSNIAAQFKRSDIATIAKEFGISKDAAKVIKNTFDQGGDIQTATANLQRAGNEAMLADAGPAAQALLDASAATGGRAGSVVRAAVGQRMSRTNEAVRGALDESLGPAPAGPRTAVNQIAERTAPARKEAYDLAYSTPIDYASDQGRNIEDALDRIEPKVLIEAIEKANAKMRAEGIVNKQVMASIGDDGSVIYREMPNVLQLDAIKKSLQSIAYKNTDDFGRLDDDGRLYNKLAGRLRDAVSDAAEPYGAAVRIGGDKLSEERAFTLGQGLLSKRTNVEDVGFELGSNPSQAQVDSAKSGLRDYIERTLGEVKSIASDPSADAMDARQVVKAVTDLSSDNSRAKVKELMGAEADALLSQIDEAAQSASVRAAMAQNSKTAGRQSIQGTVDELTAPNAAQQVMSGELVGTTKSMVRAITGQTSEYTEAQRQRIFSDIAKALTEKQGDDARTALSVLQKAMDGQALTDAQTDQLSKLIATTLFAGSAPVVGRGIGAEYKEN